MVHGSGRRSLGILIDLPGRNRTDAHGDQPSDDSIVREADSKGARKRTVRDQLRLQGGTDDREGFIPPQVAGFRWRYL